MMRHRHNSRPLQCSGCARRFAWAKAKGKAPEFEFGKKDRPPAAQCTPLQHTTTCRFAVAHQRTRSAEDLAAMWKAADELCFVTLFVPGRELTLNEAEHIEPGREASRVKRLLRKAFRKLNAEEKAAVKVFGAVEPGMMEVRKNGRPVRRLVAMHAHLVIWDLPLKRVRALLRPLMVATEAVIRPLEVKAAYNPAGAQAYATKHQDDHRVMVRENGRKRFKRKPEGSELKFLQRWCTFHFTKAEVLINLRRSPNGISMYRANVAGSCDGMLLKARKIAKPKTAKDSSPTASG